jgi:hypothetical protein
VSLISKICHVIIFGSGYVAIRYCILDNQLKSCNCVFHQIEIRREDLHGSSISLTRTRKRQATATKQFISIYHIYNHNWRNIIIIYIYNKGSIKRNIPTIKQNTSRSTSGTIVSTGRPDESLSPSRKDPIYSDEKFWVSYIFFIIITGGILVLFLYITRAASNKLLSPSNKILPEEVWAYDLSGS